MKIISTSLFCLFAVVSFGQTTFLGVPVAEIEKATSDHLNRWFPTVIDNKQGGYYTNFEFDWSISQNQEKMLVTQARDLWTSAKAAQRYPENPIFLKAANHGYEYLTKQMWNKDKGGFDLYPNHNDQKYQLIYGNSFALFALAEYAKINTSGEVLGWVEKTFDWIDSVAHDDILLGYHTLILLDALKTDTPKNRDFISRQGWGQPEWKDQNTSIHLLEAFTSTYQILPLPKVKTRLKEMLDLVSKTMTQSNGSLKLYFTNNWQPIDHSTRSRKYILDHQNEDHISFGHNIETAYLIIDASKALNGKVDMESLAIAKKLTDHTLKFGFAPNYYGLFDRGYQFGESEQIEIIMRSKAWWAQFEAWHTLALMSSYFPEEKQYEQAFRQMWRYIQRELIDHEFGGCYSQGLDETPDSKKAMKAYQWKCPYHDGRALIMVTSYLETVDK